MGGRHRLCPTAAGLTSPLPLGAAPQPSARQLFLHHVWRKMLSEAGSPSLVRVQGVTMRIVVIGLVLLAGLKVWTQDRMYRSVTGEVLIEAYRERAIEVCRKQSAKTAHAAAQYQRSLGFGFRGRGSHREPRRRRCDLGYAEPEVGRTVSPSQSNLDRSRGNASALRLRSSRRSSDVVDALGSRANPATTKRTSA